MIRSAIAALLLAAAPAHAQQQPQDAADAPGAVLRALDTISGETIDFELPAGSQATFGTLVITLRACRYPVGNPTSDAYAGLRIQSALTDDPLFDGWMIASAPALSALDHPRYDVWVIRCMATS